MSQESKANVNELDFSELILGFSSAALCYMGYDVGENSHGIKKNISLAKQNIDIVRLLKEKTANNLSDQEQKLITQILADLQLKFAEAKK